MFVKVKFTRIKKLGLDNLFNDASKIVNMKIRTYVKFQNISRRDANST